MTRKPLKDHSASIRQRLLNHARAHGDDYQRIMTRYAIERLLFRISRTEARDLYTLKGAMLPHHNRSALRGYNGRTETKGAPRGF
jgi:hypothetical protein